MDMKEIPSIWDGWDKQSVGPRDEEGGSCAYMYIMDRYGDRSIIHSVMRQKVSADTHRRYLAVGNYLANFVFSQIKSECGSPMTPSGAIFYANDRMRFTPEKFREIDRMLEYSRIQKELSARVDSVQVNSPVEVKDADNL